MGLDMWLYARANEGLEPKEELGYWRKANAIHGWFVRECAGGVDECQPIQVSREKLRELLNLCLEVYKMGPGVGPSVLPTQEGFFFGDTGYNVGYVNDIFDTICVLAKAFASKHDEFVYRASW